MHMYIQKYFGCKKWSGQEKSMPTGRSDMGVWSRPLISLDKKGSQVTRYNK